MTAPEPWDQPRIAAAFGVSVNTVQSSWRNATLRTLREHLAAHGLDEGSLQPYRVEEITRDRWRELRAQLCLPPLRLPKIALPLPDTVFGNKPGWQPASIQRWADDTDRRDAAGHLCRSSPPGRPPGVVETRPRRRTAEVAR